MPLGTPGGGVLLPGTASQEDCALYPTRLLQGGMAAACLGPRACAGALRVSEEERQSPGVRGWEGAGPQAQPMAGFWRPVQPCASSGDGCQHQEQAAQPHHLHGDRGSQSAGGLR